MGQGDILGDVSNYYSKKLEQHGANHAGVDWNSIESQYLRFRQLLQLHNKNPEANCSLLDYGCGYGELVRFLKQQQYTFTYTGYDIAPAMIERAKELYASDGEFVTELQEGSTFDYVVASGIFNVRLEVSDENWLQHILETLQKMWQYAENGMAFNCLTSYSDKEYMRDYLYYTDPNFLFDYCKRQFSRQVALLHDYGLYEFTILVRKDV